MLLRPVLDDAGETVDLLFAYANARTGDVAGLPADELVGQRVLVALPAFPRDVFDAFVEVLRTGEPLHTTMDYYRDAFAGHPVFAGVFQITASRLGGDAVIVIFDDVAERARARAAERRYGAVLKATSDWVSIADRDHRLVYVNPGGRRMVGIGPDEDITGTPIGGFSPPWAGRSCVARHSPWRCATASGAGTSLACIATVARSPSRRSSSPEPMRAATSTSTPRSRAT